MNMNRTPFLLIVALFMIGSVTQSLADPFVISAERCAKYEPTGKLMCAENANKEKPITIGDYTKVKQWKLTPEKIRFLNGWDSSVSMETIVPVGAKIAFMGSLPFNANDIEEKQKSERNTQPKERKTTKLNVKFHISQEACSTKYYCTMTTKPMTFGEFSKLKKITFGQFKSLNNLSQITEDQPASLYVLYATGVR